MPRRRARELDDGEEDAVDIATPSHTVATNIAAPTSSPSTTRRRRGPRLLRRPKKRQRPSTEPDTEDVFSELASLSDGILALHTLQNAWPHAALDILPKTPPLLLHTQLKAIVSDLPALHRELSVAVARRDVLRLRLPTGDEAYVMRADVVPADAPNTLVDLLRAAEGRPAVSTSELTDAGMKDEDVTKLVREGYLTIRDEVSFWLAVPGMGGFVSQRASGRKEVLGLLKRSPYREMLLDKLEMRTLKKSIFTAQWHVRDIVGSGEAETVATSVGTLVRLKST